ncbi:hypothetical protein FNV43_RR26669 [Rhamnella rubrinervis]|uniref:Elongator complex protein 2 n=1 Tax=Rhamnella rubrinervis TaxID=2594499 RepID=A0A8K0DN02_9ROSA|nr:hypothetical protein FNV43_RR26669 [Rhamnella rubrinervis]
MSTGGDGGREVEVNRVFIGAGCNRVVNNVSWGACGLVAFGAQNAVSIFCPESAQIQTTLPGHTAVVNCTQWLPSAKFSFKAKHLERHYLLSGDADGTIILWELDLLSGKWRHVLQVPESHKKGVTCITGIMVSETVAIFASTSSDSSVHIWELTFPSTNGGDCKLLSLESLSVGSKPMVALALAELPGNTEHLVLAMGGLDNKIHLYCGERTGKFIHACELKGHTDWIRSLDFSLPICANGEGKPILLVSSSQDRGIRIWKMALHNDDLATRKTSGIWMNVVTVGELSHCALGFYGGHWSSNGNSILAHGYGGSFHLWKNVGVDLDNWQPQKVPSGHFAAVADISWAKSGEYLLSVSHDQTTRIFAPWQREASFRDGVSWHEIARPQVHGHDINCATIIQGKGNHRFVSGADEKVARVFEAPLSFLKTLNHAILQKSSEDLQSGVQILGANMSALGLSQKPIYVQADHETTNRNGNDASDTLETIPDAVPVVLTEPPIEDQLAWHTLWPESHKLYGHGNELFSLCCDHGGNLVASSCKAQSATVAEIWLWEVGSWKAVGQLSSHSLTVTQMEFSHDDKLLLSVSRDRQFSVFTIERTGPNDTSYQLLARQEAHKRIIWACSWNPFGHEFATGSRDKTVKIWAVENQSSVKHLTTLPQFKTSITALSWAGLDRKRNSGLLAIGMENGLIELWSLSIDRTLPSATAALVYRLDPVMCHASAVNRLAWRSPEKSEDSSSIQLASCGADNCVRVFDVKVD